jgi:hypothetical protein
MFKHMYFLTLFLLLAGCSSMQVKSDYDPDFDFEPLASFAVVYPVGHGGSTLTQSRIADAITEQMLQKGYRPAEKSDADFIMLFHTDITSKKQIITDYRTVGFYPYYGYAYGTVTVPVQHDYYYDEGKIIIDALNPDGNRIFWRAVSTDRLKTFDTPDERIAYIRNVVGAMLESFPGKSKEP